MMCEECGIRQAAFHLTTIVGDERRERSLCPICFAKYQKKLPGLDFSGLAGILSGILEAGTGKNGEKEKEDEENSALVCETCGMTYGEFKRSGMLGCAKCYSAFREPLEALLTRVHGNTQHAGRIPGSVRSSASIRMNIERLRQQLAKAVSDEEYEEAAQLRDRIRALTKQLEDESADEGGAEDGR